MFMVSSDTDKPTIWNENIRKKTDFYQKKKKRMKTERKIIA